MILLTDSYGNPCCVQEEWIQMAFIAKGETDTTILMSSGESIAVRESPEDIYEFTEGVICEVALEDNCETCRHHLNAETDEPCCYCSVNDPDNTDSMWEEEDVGDTSEGAGPDPGVGEGSDVVRVSGVPYPVKLSSIRRNHDEGK